MSFWTNQPFLRIATAFVLGIIASRMDIAVPFLAIPSCLWISFIVIIIGKISLKHSPNLIWGNLLLLLIFLLGFYRYQRSDSSQSSAQTIIGWQKCQATIGTITSFPTHKNRFVVYEVELKTGMHDSSFMVSPAKLLLYEFKDSLNSSQYQYGDKVRITGNPHIIEPPRNPNEFDFSKYMSDQGIQLQQFASPDQIRLISTNHGNAIMSAVYRLRTHFEEIIRAQIKGKDEQAIVLALLLGLKGELDTETKNAYAAAGAMHVLAVSGLHVSIIYFILIWLFKGMPEGDFKRFLVPTISIVSLWLYALLTGFSPSILRAVSMFSIIILAQILNRKSQIFNSLALAAFILLLINPFYLFNIGFQLSFLAVAGIVYIYPRISSLWSINNMVGEYVWKLTCVSIAAQISTFPLSLYYFNQFPTYFLLTNIIVIPAASIIMILGISTLVLSPITNWVGWLLEKTVFLMNYCVHQIEKFDGSVIDWIFITGFQATLIYVIIVASIAFLVFKRLAYAYVIILSFAIFGVNRISQYVAQSNCKSLLFYSTGKSRILDQINNFNAELITLDTISNFEVQTRYISPYRLSHFLTKPNTPTMASCNFEKYASMHVFNGKKMLFIIHPFDDNQIQFRLKTDLVIVSNQSIESLSTLDQSIEFEEIILDGTNDFAYTSRLKKEAQTLGYKLSSLHEQAHLIRLSGDKKFLDMFF